MDRWRDGTTRWPRMQGATTRGAAACCVAAQLARPRQGGAVGCWPHLRQTRPVECASAARALRCPPHRLPRAGGLGARPWAGPAARRARAAPPAPPGRYRAAACASARPAQAGAVRRRRGRGCVWLQCDRLDSPDATSGHRRCKRCTFDNDQAEACGRVQHCSDRASDRCARPRVPDFWRERASTALASAQTAWTRPSGTRRSAGTSDDAKVQ
jgi:hypothetical protein